MNRWQLALGALALLACDPTALPKEGEACSSANSLVCGRALSGASSALSCRFVDATKKTEKVYQVVSACGTDCSHVSDDGTVLECDGEHVACESERCDIVGAGACSTAGDEHLLSCRKGAAGSSWTLLSDCAALGKQCGFLPDGNIGCR
jgi:hypothetical protein